MQRIGLMNKVLDYSRALSKYVTIHFSKSLQGSLCDFTEFSSNRFKSTVACELTSSRYEILRGPYNKISENDIQYFKSFLDEHRVIRDDEELLGHNTDWLKMVRGSSSLLLKPKYTEEVSRILSYCNERNLAVCPQGGNTGLVGGSVPVFDEIIISSLLMNKVESIDEYSGALICQSGCVLEHLEQQVNSYGLMMPLDLGAKGSCHIGGNISTNAGGIRLLRYGNLHGSILGLEVVLASGEVIDCMSSMRKDNTGYDLKHLFVGSEGTLGFITKVSLYCPPKPKSCAVALLGLQEFKSVLETFQMAKQFLGEILSSCEFMDNVSMDATVVNLKKSCPIRSFPFYVLIEVSGSNMSHDEEKLSRFLEHILSSRIVEDGTVASEPSKISEIWSLREQIAEALLHDGYSYKYDISLPLPVFYQVVETMQKRLEGKVKRCCGYGHIGDGNLHFNATSDAFRQDVVDLIEPFIYDVTAKHNGSISAEHGLGFKKKDFIHFSKSTASVHLMKRIKSLMDPKGIMNPYKVLPEHP